MQVQRVESLTLRAGLIYAAVGELYTTCRIRRRIKPTASFVALYLNNTHLTELRDTISSTPMVRVFDGSRTVETAARLRDRSVVCAPPTSRAVATGPLVRGCARNFNCA